MGVDKAKDLVTCDTCGKRVPRKLARQVYYEAPSDFGPGDSVWECLECYHEPADNYGDDSTDR